MTTWHKSSYSGSQTNCIEVGSATGVVKIRDTKDRQGPALIVSADAWRRFTMRIKGLGLTLETRAGTPVRGHKWSPLA